MSLGKARQSLCYNPAELPEYPQKLVILTGMSGAGKTTALRCFEDMGFFCVDNIPPQIIDTFLQLGSQVPTRTRNLAVVCDVRSGALFDDFARAWQEIKPKVEALSLIFLDAADDVLLRRFKELRRQHPLAQSRMSNEEAIRAERGRLEPLKGFASEVIDTSALTAAQLTDTIRSLFVAGDRRSLISITLMSFGYKYGLPPDADFVFDTRFLPNPFYVEELRDLSGTDPKVREFVFADGKAEWFGEQISEILARTLDGFAHIQKINVLVALGCTGGKHRSVALVDWLRDRLEGEDQRVLVIHRDVDKL